MGAYVGAFFIFAYVFISKKMVIFVIYSYYRTILFQIITLRSSKLRSPLVTYL